MPILDLYKTREYSTVKLNDGNDYKIPNEFTVEEFERLLEKRSVYEKIKNEEVVEGHEDAQKKRFFNAVFNQLVILFQHYHPDMTADELKKILTPKEALEILNFFDEYRHLALEGAKSEDETTEPKKKLKN